MRRLVETEVNHIRVMSGFPPMALASSAQTQNEARKADDFCDSHLGTSYDDDDLDIETYKLKLEDVCEKVENILPSAALLPEKYLQASDTQGMTSAMSEYV